MVLPETLEEAVEYVGEEHARRQEQGQRRQVEIRNLLVQEERRHTRAIERCHREIELEVERHQQLQKELEGVLTALQDLNGTEDDQYWLNNIPARQTDTQERSRERPRLTRSEKRTIKRRVQDWFKSL